MIGGRLGVKTRSSHNWRLTIGWTSPGEGVTCTRSGPGLLSSLYLPSVLGKMCWISLSFCISFYKCFRLWNVWSKTLWKTYKSRKMLKHSVYIQCFRVPEGSVRVFPLLTADCVCFLFSKSDIWLSDLTSSSEVHNGDITFWNSCQPPSDYLQICFYRY